MATGVSYPEPQMDWEVIRLAKVRCELRCAEFDDLIGACRFLLLPGIECPRFRLSEVSEGVGV